MGWIDRVLGWAYNRARGVVEAEDRAAEEHRAAIRNVMSALSEAMTFAEDDREHGRNEAERSAIEAANRAAALVGEVDDEAARSMVAEWKRQWDAIPKGYKLYTEVSVRPPGFPQAAWDALREAERHAQDRLGEALRALRGAKRP